MIDDNLRYSGTIPDERLHDMHRDLRSPMGGGHGGSGGSGPRGAGVFLVDQVFTRSQDDTYQATKSAFLNPLHKASYGVRIGDIVLFYLNTEGILCTGIVTAISGETVTFVKHDEISTVGFSPSIATTEITGGHRVTVTNESGSESFDVMDGVQGPQGEPFEFDDFTPEQLDELRSDVASVYYRKQEATVINFNDVSTIEIPFDNFTFADMLFVDIEGLALTENQDYVINGSTIELTTPITHPNTRINFKLLTIMAITSEDLDTLLEGLADFNGATDSADGTHGLVPAPAAGDDLDVLFGNGEWGALNLTTFSWGNDQSISIQANFDNEQAPAALFGSTSLPLASATKAGLMKLEDYSKLQGIQAGAQANVIESISVNGTAVDVNNKNAAISIPQASSDSAGLMAASDKTKLDTISAFSSDNKAALFADGIWWHLFNEMTTNGHLLLKRGRSTGGSTPTPIIETIDDMPMLAASEYTPGLMTTSDKAKLNGIETGANAYTLPAATTATLGGVKPDGTTVTVDVDGTIHAAGGSGGSGYNPSLSVGRADALTGADSTAQWAQRESTGSGAATVRSVQGAAVAWNQFIVNGNFEQKSNWTELNVSYTVSDNVATMLATAQDGRIYQSSVLTKKAGDKILVVADVNPTTQCTVGIGSWYSGSYNSDFSVSPGWNRLAFVFTVTADNSGLPIAVIDRRASDWDAIQIRNFMAFNLTQMFGSGNEPSTVAEFEQMYPASYYPYSAPTLKPVQIAGIASTDAQGGELDSIEWTAQTLRAAGSVADMLYSDHVDVKVGAYTFTGNEVAAITDWRHVDGTYAAVFPLSMIPDRSTNKINYISNAKMAQLNSVSYGALFEATVNGFSMATGDSDTMYSFIVRVPTSIASTQSELMSWLAGQTLYYELATPTTTPISPALPMSYKVQQGGTESIIVPDGEVSAAPIITAAEGESAAELVMDALAAIAAPDGPVATANHSVGTYLTYNGKLYKVTSAIAVGETIVAGTNVTQTTVMAELLALTA